MIVVYKVVSYWRDREQPVVWEGTAEELKSYLDKEVFCLKHGRPLPNGVEIYRTRP